MVKFKKRPYSNTMGGGGGRDGTGQTGQTNRHTDRQIFLGKYYFRWIYAMKTSFNMISTLFFCSLNVQMQLLFHYFDFIFIYEIHIRFLKLDFCWIYQQPTYNDFMILVRTLMTKISIQGGYKRMDPYSTRMIVFSNLFWAFLMCTSHKLLFIV